MNLWGGLNVIWFLLFVCILVALVLWLVGQRRKFARQVSAEYERICREEPESEIGRLGENEFRLRYERALQMRSNKLALLVLLSTPITVLVPAYLIINGESGMMYALALATCIGGLVAVIRYGLTRSPSVIDLMRQA